MSFREPLTEALGSALRYLDTLDRAPVDATVTRDQLIARLGRPLADSGLDATQVIRDLVHDVEGGIVGTAGPRFFGWVIGGAVPASLAADWLTSVWDQPAGLHAAGPAAAVVE